MKGYRLTLIIVFTVSILLLSSLSILIPTDETDIAPSMAQPPIGYGTRGTNLTIEIDNNGVDDDGDGSTDEPGAIAVDGRITNGADHAAKTTEFHAAGRVIDEIEFGYIHWNATSGDTFDPDGDQNDRDNSFGEHNGTKQGTVGKYSFFWTGSEVSWDFYVPVPGYYVWSIYSWTSSSNGRYISPRYWNGTHKVTLEDNHDAIDMYLLQFNRSGTHRFYAYGRDRNYMFHSQLFTVRQEPIDSYGAHPRLATNQTDLANFRARLNRSWIQVMRNDTISDANSLIAGDVNTANIGDPRGTEGRLSDLAVAYLATGDNAIAAWGIQYLKRVLNRTHWMPGASWSYLGIGEYGLGVAIAYDAFYPVMSPIDKEHCVNRADMLYNYIFINSINAEHRGDNSHWWSDPTSNNWNAVTNGGGLGTGALSFFGDNKYSDQWLDQAIQTQRWFLEKCFDSDGAYEESIMYQGYACSSTALFMQSLLENHGVDVFRHNNDTMRKGAYYNLYFFEPSRQQDSPFDQQTRWSIMDTYKYVGPPDAFWFAVARVYQDGQMQRFTRMVYGDMMAADRYHDYAGYLPRCLLSYSEVPEVPAEQWDLPLAEVWPDFGRVAMRTGFNDTRDYYLALQSGLFGSHGHADQSSFIIHALGQVLAEDNDYNLNPSINQNVILVDGIGQTDGTDPEYPGKIESFFHSDVLDFTMADSTLGYTSNGVNIDHNKRNALFVRPTADQDGYYIIADNIRSNETHDYEWGIHHQVDGHVIQDMGGSDFRFFNTTREGPDLDIRFACPGETTFTNVSNRLGVMPKDNGSEMNFTVLLYPSNATIPMPAVTKINTTTFSGFSFNNDLVLYNKDGNMNSHGGTTTDGKLSLTRSITNGRVMAMINGTGISDGALTVNTSIYTNLAIENIDKNYTMKLGEELSSTCFAMTVKFSGLAQGVYAYSLDGTHQLDIPSADGNLDIFLLSCRPHDIDLTHIGLITPVNQLPRALAGADTTAYVNDTVTLNGSGSYDPDGSIVTWNWTCVSHPLLSIQNINSSYPGFVPDTAGEYNLTLMVVDDQGGVSLPALVNVTVVERNKPPVANAGEDFYSHVDDDTTLDGTDSQDPDGSIVTWLWTSVNRTVTFTYPNSSTPSFTPGASGKYVFTLMVMDDFGEWSLNNDTVNVTVLADSQNKIPTAKAGEDQTVHVNTTVYLDGSNSTDTDGSVTAYAWDCTSHTGPGLYKLRDRHPVLLRLGGG